MSEEQSFEQAFAQLEEIVQRLEAGGLDLEASLALFEEGVKLARWCETKLDEAQLRVDQLVGDELAPFEES
ncbi:MAG: exodeoxyribonuclease VII small subunit [Chloroflexi bacterium]|nr:exodeoxyribonuclease VII small subunit [Chloroflexota bacterium]